VLNLLGQERDGSIDVPQLAHQIRFVQQEVLIRLVEGERRVDVPESLLQFVECPLAAGPVVEVDLVAFVNVDGCVEIIHTQVLPLLFVEGESPDVELV